MSAAAVRAEGPARARAPRAATLVAVTTVAVLAAGLVPMWTLALRTPFRLVDDYGALAPLQNVPVLTLLRDAFSLRVNPVRFRPTHDLGQVLCWSLLGASPAAHHALRLAMKALAFAAFVGVARREAVRAGGRTPRGASAAAALALAGALFFYVPNAPEARLAPQELALTLYLLGALFFVGWRGPRVPAAAADALFFVSFVLALWSKEPAFVVAAPVLSLAFVRQGDPPRGVSAPWRLAALAAWLHAAAKAMVMSAGGGYGRPPLSAAGVRRMVASIPEAVLLTGSVPWLWTVFLVGAALFAWRQRARPRLLQSPAAVLWALLAAALLQYLLLWGVVLRYAFPLTVVLSLLAVTGFAAALAGAATAAADRWALGVSALALAVAGTGFFPTAAQFAMQEEAGRGEQAALRGAEEAVRAGGGPLHSAGFAEQDYRARVYFTDYLPRYEGRRVDVKAWRRAADVPPGGLLLVRAAVPDGFDAVTRFATPEPPALLRWAAVVSRAALLGRAPAPPPLDAGADGLTPPPWFLARRRS